MRWLTAPLCCRATPPAGNLGPTFDILAEAVPSRTYGVPLRLIRSGSHISCVAEVEA
jgi:iron complex transport system ATP-binding protein